MFDDATVARFLSGEATPEQQIQLRRWLEADPANQHRLDRLRDAWSIASARTAPKFDVARMRHNIATRTSGGHRALRTQSTIAWLIPAAAAAALIVVAVQINQRPTADSMAVLEPKEITTTHAQRADVYLSDGTHVLLAPESRLRFTSPLADSARDVVLEGRALFEVTHDSVRPFRVHTQIGVAEDLGTRFDVQQYAGDTTLRVVVAEGLVGLKGVTLKHGDRGVIGSAGVVNVTSGVDIAREMGWATGQLSFEAVPLRDAVRELRRFYDLEFVITSPEAGARRLTATFRHEPPSEVVHTIAVSADLRHQLRGKTATFSLKESSR